MKEEILNRIKELVSQRGGSTYDLCDHQDDQDILDNGIPISGFGAGRKLVGYAISVEDDVWCLHVVDLNDDEEEMIELENLDQVALKMIQDRVERLEGDNYQFGCPNCGAYWEEEWTCAADDDCPSCGKKAISPHAVWDKVQNAWIELGDEPKNSKSWFVHRVIGLTEPTLEGPFANDDEALEGAKVNFDRDDCTFGLVIDWEKREVQTYAFDYDVIEDQIIEDQLRQEDEQE